MCKEAINVAEAEHVALYHAVQEPIWLRHFFTNVGYMQTEATSIYEDSQPCMVCCIQHKLISAIHTQ